MPRPNQSCCSSCGAPGGSSNGVRPPLLECVECLRTKDVSPVNCTSCFEAHWVQHRDGLVSPTAVASPRSPPLFSSGSRGHLGSPPSGSAGAAGNNHYQQRYDYGTSPPGSSGRGGGGGLLNLGASAQGNGNGGNSGYHNQQQHHYNGSSSLESPTHHGISSNGNVSPYTPSAEERSGGGGGGNRNPSNGNGNGGGVSVVGGLHRYGSDAYDLVRQGESERGPSSSSAGGGLLGLFQNNSSSSSSASAASLAAAASAAAASSPVAAAAAAAASAALQQLRSESGSSLGLGPIGGGNGGPAPRREWPSYR